MYYIFMKCLFHPINSILDSLIHILICLIGLGLDSIFMCIYKYTVYNRGTLLLRVTHGTGLRGNLITETDITGK